MLTRSNKVIGFKVTEEEHGDVLAAASKRGLDISSLLRRAVNAFLRRDVLAETDQRYREGRAPVGRCPRCGRKRPLHSGRCGGCRLADEIEAGRAG